MEKLYNFILANDIHKYIHYWKSSVPLIIIKYPDEVKAYTLDIIQRWNYFNFCLSDKIDFNEVDLVGNKRRCSACFNKGRCHIYNYNTFLCSDCDREYVLSNIISKGVWKRPLILNPYLGIPNKSSYILNDKLCIWNYYDLPSVNERFEITINTDFDFDHHKIILQDECRYCGKIFVCLKCLKIKIYILWLTYKDHFVNFDLIQDINLCIHRKLASVI
jgi:hypothetical protein